MLRQPSPGANVRDYPAFENRKGWGSLIVEIQSVENQSLGQPPSLIVEIQSVENQSLHQPPSTLEETIRENRVCHEEPK
jgi:hypothetical protein